MSNLDLIALAKTLAQLETAYSILSDVWNQSMPGSIRKATGQDEMKPVMAHLHKQIAHLRKIVHGDYEEGF